MTDLEICNTALAHLGEAPISSLAEASTAARACSLFYGQTRDAVLRSHRWNFATARAALTEGATPEFGWSHSFALPVGWLRVCEVNGSEFNEGEDYVIEGASLLTNEEVANIVFVKSESNTAIYDPIFVEAFAIRLAVKLCDAIRGSSSKQGELMALYNGLIGPLARRIDANEGRRRKPANAGNSALVMARGVRVSNGAVRP